MFPFQLGNTNNIYIATSVLCFMAVCFKGRNQTSIQAPQAFQLSTEDPQRSFPFARSSGWTHKGSSREAQLAPWDTNKHFNTGLPVTKLFCVVSSVLSFCCFYKLKCNSEMGNWEIVGKLDWRQYSTMLTETIPCSWLDLKFLEEVVLEVTKSCHCPSTFWETHSI